jgi:RNA methyltransferase, TrmH family
MQKYSPKFIKSLSDKKNRKASGVFVVEGTKNILEVVESDYVIKQIFCTKEMYNSSERLLGKKKSIVTYLEAGEIKNMSSFEFNNTGIAIVEQKENKPFEFKKGEIIIALDEIRDPGNLGTIIRIADWYGIKKILCSPSSVDLYNPKVIAASMGSFCRVEIFYTELEKSFENYKHPIIGTFLKGENVHKYSFPKEGILLIGNESNGVSEYLEKFITQKITIPRFGKAESLNAGIATAVILDNWRRN